MRAKRPPLPLLYPERAEEDHRRLRAAGISLPSWKQLEHDFAAFPEHKVREGSLSADNAAAAAIAKVLNFPRILSKSRLDLLDVDVAIRLPAFKPWLQIAIRSMEKAGFDRATIEKQIRGMTQHYLMQRAWRHFGSRVFVLDPTTFALLAETDLPKIPVSEIAAPLPVFYIKIPTGSFRFADQPAEGILAAISPAEPSSEQRLLSVVVTPSTRRSETVFQQKAMIAPDSPVSDIRLPSTDEVETDEHRAFSTTVPRAIFGFLLYMASEHPLLEPVPPSPAPKADARRNPAKKRKAEQRAETYSQLGYVYVGGERDAEGTGMHGGERGSWSLDHQVWVRGHFRQQPHGPGRHQRKVLWIKPHRRGPDAAASLALQAQKVQPARLKRKRP